MSMSMSRRMVAGALAGVLVAVMAACTSTGADPTPAGGTAARSFAPGQPRTDHPRLFVRTEDLPRLRSWAGRANPIYQEGLAVKVAQAEQLVADGIVPSSDSGLWSSYESYPTESYAELFAFMSLVHPDQGKRDEYGKLARRLLLHVIDKGYTADRAGTRLTIAATGTHKADRAGVLDLEVTP
jgi:hypothetical protein